MIKICFLKEMGKGLPCPGGWLEVDNMCYKMIESSKYDWYNAKEGCRNEGGSLVKIHDSRDQDFMDRFLLNGANADLKTNLFWIGKDLYILVRTRGQFNKTISLYTCNYLQVWLLLRASETLAALVNYKCKRFIELIPDSLCQGSVVLAN